jgi:hypothetical protein
MLSVLALQLVVLHLGALHPVEKVLTLALAFGPFAVLGLVIALRRRHEAEEEADPAVGPAVDPAVDPGERLSG